MINLVAVSNFISAYDIREGKILEWAGSRLKQGIAKVNFVSGDYAAGVTMLYSSDNAIGSLGGVSGYADKVAVAMNMDTIVVAKPIEVSYAIQNVDWSWVNASHALIAREAVSGRVVVVSGQVDISGQSVVLQVFGT